jgi:hypothetical protein
MYNPEQLSMLPDYMRDGMRLYIERGVPPGHFMSALLSNDLKETFARADHINARAVGDYVKFLYNHAPSGCWGSKSNFEGWVDKGGMVGLGLMEAAQ